MFPSKVLELANLCQVHQNNTKQHSKLKSTFTTWHKDKQKGMYDSPSCQKQ